MHFVFKMISLFGGTGREMYQGIIHIFRGVGSGKQTGKSTRL